MCTFELVVTMCRCIDPNCPQRGDRWGEDTIKYAGHIDRVLSCKKISDRFKTTSRRCDHGFTNREPERDLVKWGMNPDDPSSMLDCWNGQYVIKRTERSKVYCPKCMYDCCDGEMI